MRAFRNLPKSPSKKVAVVKELANKIGIIKKPDIESKSHLTQSDIQKVKEFYLSDDISLQLPGKKDCVSKVIDGENVLLQKKILLMPIVEAYNLFKKENEHIKIGKSKFFQLRPPNVFSVTDKDHIKCCCIYCENYKLLIQSIQNTLPKLPSYKDTISSAICILDSEDCHLGTCITCQNVETVVHNLFQNIDETI